MLLPRPYREQRKSCVFRVFFTLVSHFIPCSSTFLAIQPYPPSFSLILKRVSLRRTKWSDADSWQCVRLGFIGVISSYFGEQQVSGNKYARCSIKLFAVVEACRSVIVVVFAVARRLCHYVAVVDFISTTLASLLLCRRLRRSIVVPAMSPSLVVMFVALVAASLWWSSLLCRRRLSSCLSSSLQRRRYVVVACRRCSVVFVSTQPSLVAALSLSSLSSLLCHRRTVIVARRLVRHSLSSSLFAALSLL
jgi:hypothetical protein